MNFVDLFFSELDKNISQPVKVILTGAMAGILLGNIRPSMDIDFEVEFSSLDEGSYADIESAIDKASRTLNLPAQYSENIQGWSQISFLDYKETSSLYKQIGKIEVRLMSPEHWSIGKMARYVEMDELDVVHVFKKHRISWEKIVVFWGRALKKSPRSDISRQFRDHVIHFLEHRGKDVWGQAFEPKIAIERFTHSH